MSDAGSEVKHLSVLSGTEDYQRLADALAFAFQQSAGADGKGKERHGTTSVGSHVPFNEQAIYTMGKMFRNGPVPSGLLYQVGKKAQEAQRMAPSAAIQELRGVIVYAATAMLIINEEQPDKLF